MRDSQKLRAYPRERLIRTGSTARLTFCRGFGGLTVGAAALALLLVACTSPHLEAGPSTSSPTTVIVTTAQAPPPSTAVPTYQPATADGPAQNVPVPVLPAEAKEFSKEGLLAFTEYWYETLGYAFETGDPEPMMSISGANCLTCQAIRKMVTAGHEGGKWISGGKMVLGQPNASFVITPEGTYQVTVMARQEQVRYFKSDKSLSKELGVGISEPDILVGVFQDGGWIATTVEHLSGSDGT